MTAIRWAAAILILAFAWTLGAETNDATTSGDGEEQAQSKLVLEDGARLSGIPLSEVEQCLSKCDCLRDITVVQDCDGAEHECPDGPEFRDANGVSVATIRRNGVVVHQSVLVSGVRVSKVSDHNGDGILDFRECTCSTQGDTVTIRESDEDRDGSADHRTTTCIIRGVKKMLLVDEVAGEQEGEWRVRRALRTSRLVH